ncbi:MAG: hypothetical protein MK213_01965, partial [Planctomycetes bacterium]|nr:hypothetical protein [Planctomycetota bacterium]
MTVRNRGAAQVSVMWVIALTVLLLFTAFFSYLGSQNAAEWEASYVDAQAATAAAKADASASYDQVTALSAATGFAADAASGHASPATIQSALDELKGTFAGAGDANTLEAALPGVIGDFNALMSTNASLTQSVAQLRNDLASRESSHADALRSKDSVSSDLRNELDDLRSSMNSANVDLENQRDSLRDQVRDYERQVAELRLRLEDSQRVASEQDRVAKQNLDILGQKLNTVSRRSDSPDGAVLTANAKLGKAWIDLGRTDRVRSGMEFVVTNSLTGAEKGRVRVISVEVGRSECSILEMTDAFDPIAGDDLVTNAVFDPNRQPVAVLLGNGFGKFSAADMSNMLGEVGIVVAGEITNEADYLI